MKTIPALAAALCLASTLAYGAATVNTQGNDNTFTGVNTFTQPIVGSVTGSALTAGTASYAATAGHADTATTANDPSAVHLSGAQTVGGFKNFSGGVGAADIIVKGPWVDVRAKGFACDNSVGSATSNASALRAALADAAGLVASGNKSVIIPGGVCYIDNSAGPIIVPVGVQVYGNGGWWNGGTVAKFTDPTKDGFVLANDGHYTSRNGLHRMWIEGAYRGFYAEHGGMIDCDNVYLTDNVIGWEIYDVNVSTFTLIVSYANQRGAYHNYDHSSTRTTDQNVYNNCAYNWNTVSGLTIWRGQGNTHISPEFVSNLGPGLIIDDEVADSGSANFLTYANRNKGGGDTFISPYIEDHPTANSQPILIVRNSRNFSMDNAFFINYSPKPDGLITLTSAARVSIKGMYNDNASPTIGTLATIDRTSWEVSFDVQGKTKAGVVDNGINTKIYGRWAPDLMSYDSEADTLSNTFFQNPGGGGADVVASWGETGATGNFSLDSSDLVFPKSISAYSLKITKGATAAACSIGETTRSLTTGGKYYLNVTYKDDTAAGIVNAPLLVHMQNTADSNKAYNFNTGAWDDSGYDWLSLPPSDKPYTLSIPFTAPASSSAVNVLISSPSGNANNAVYHIYNVDIATVPAGNGLSTILKSLPPIALPYTQAWMPNSDYVFGAQGEKILTISSSVASHTITVNAPRFDGDFITIINSNGAGIAQTVNVTVPVYYYKPYGIQNASTKTLVLADGDRISLRGSGGTWYQEAADSKVTVFTWANNANYVLDTLGKYHTDVHITANNTIAKTLTFPATDTNAIGRRVYVWNKGAGTVTLGFNSETVYAKDTYNTVAAVSTGTTPITVPQYAERKFYNDGAAWIEF